jgi:hypothetical protein
MSHNPIQLWAPDDLLAAHGAWLGGWGDLPFVAHRRPVPPIVQLGVLAHAPWGRLADLAAAGPHGRAGLTWGRAGLAHVRSVLAAAGSPPGLVTVQSTDLQPRERDLLDAGRMDLTSAELAAVAAGRRVSRTR